MGRLIKWLAGLFVVLLLLLVAAVLILPKVIDPNDHKQEIIAAVKEQTGRDLALNADLQLSVFPWLGVETGDVVLGNAQGFGNDPFAKVRELGLRVKVLPLFSGQVEVDTLVLDGLALNLSVDKSGRNNWDDLAGDKSADKQGAKSADEASSDAGFALHIQGVKITDAQVSWNDQRSGDAYVLSNLHLTSGAITSGVPVPLEAGFLLESTQPARQMRLDIKGKLTFDEGAQRLAIPDLGVDVQLQGDGLPSEGLAIALGAGVDADLGGERLALSKLQVQGAGLDLQGELQVSGFKSKPEASGKLVLAKSDLRQVLAGLGVMVDTADPKALSAVNAEFGLRQQGDVYRIEPFKLGLDQSSLVGQLRVTPGKVLALHGKFDVDQMDIDRYLAPKKEDGDAPAQPAAQQAADDPLAVLRTLDIDLSLTVKQLTAAKAKMQDVQVRLRNKAGQLHIDPLQASLYDGRLKAAISVDARSKQPKIHAVKSLSGIDLGKLLADVAGEDRLLGKGDVKIDVTTVGLAEAEQRKSLNGHGSLRLSDGAYKGVNVAEMIRKAARALGMDDGTADTGTANQTDFSEMTASFTARNGVISNQDLQAKSPLLRLSGKGQINLAADTIDYRLTTELVQSLEGQGGRAADKLAGVPIPVKIEGNLSDPKYKPDLESAVASRAKKRVEREVKKAIEGKLKGLFGR